MDDRELVETFFQSNHAERLSIRLGVARPSQTRQRCEFAEAIEGAPWKERGKHEGDRDVRSEYIDCIDIDCNVTMKQARPRSEKFIN